MLVAIPTAIPLEPLISRLGTLPGNTVGSVNESSKLGWKSTVSLLMSAEFFGQPFQPGLGITHGCRRVAINRTKVSLAIYQRVA
jgi:hypothetical protein